MSQAAANAAAHFILFVADQRRSAAFYAAVLARAPRLDVAGMTELELGPGCVLGLMPATGAQRLLGEAMAEAPSGRGPCRSELYLKVEGALAHHLRALAAGATEVSPMQLRNWGDRAAYSLDPDGHLLAFAEATAERS